MNLTGAASYSDVDSNIGRLGRHNNREGVLRTLSNNRLCEMLNITYPIIQGGMAWVSSPKLAAAVSNAGGLGLLAASSQPKESLQKQIQETKKLTNKPFGVNLMLMMGNIQEQIDVLIEEEVMIVTTGAGNPGSFFPRFKEAGIIVMPVIPSVALAKRVARQGAQAVIAEGMEAGGHIGESTTMALVPQVVNNVDVPVIAAGGIADGRGMAAAFSLGAEGIQVGTRFVVTDECEVHDDYKMMLLKASDRDTTVTGRSTGHPVRIIRNKLAREFERLEAEGASLEELEKFGTGRLRDAAKGDVEMGSVMCGQIAGMVTEIKTVADVINEMIAQSKATLIATQNKIACL